MNKKLNVSDLDFDAIKVNLKTFLQAQDQFNDYDFEGSAISTLIDLLAYVTHYNALNANVGINETFLDTAQFRGSVAGHARQLGYTPRSATASRAYVNINITPSNIEQETFILPKGFRFQSTINGVSYPFVTVDTYRVPTNRFENVLLVQGESKTVEYIYDARSNEKYIIPAQNVDISTITIEVFDSTESGLVSSTYIKAKDIVSIDSESKVYFLHENPDGLYEVTFGDGILGKLLSPGNIIKITYLVTDQEITNGARVFSALDQYPDGSLGIITSQKAVGGGPRESIDQIKRNAPITFASQNRAVTVSDFEAIIREGFGNIDAIKVWGGEDALPPVYGKVFISIKPMGGLVLSTQEKSYILDSILRPKSTVTVQSEIVDPEFVYITLEVFFNYDASSTRLGPSELQSKVIEAISEYNNSLSKFDQVFRSSKLLSTIDNSDPSILNSTIRVYLQKQFVPALDIPRTYTLEYSANLYNGVNGIIHKSSFFTYNGITKCRFKDYVSGDGTRYVSIVSGIDTAENIIVKYAGKIERDRIILENFAPSGFEDSSIWIQIIPDSNDIISLRNNILIIDTANPRFSVIGSDSNSVISRHD